MYRLTTTRCLSGCGPQVRTLGGNTCLKDRVNGAEICGQGKSTNSDSGRYTPIMPPPDTHMPINRPELMAVAAIGSQVTPQMPQEQSNNGLVDWLGEEAFWGIKKGYLVGGAGLLATIALLAGRRY